MHKTFYLIFSCAIVFIISSISVNSYGADSVTTGSNPKVLAEITSIEKVGSQIIFKGTLQNTSTANEVLLTPFFTTKIMSKNQGGKIVGSGNASFALRKGETITFFMQALLSSDQDINDLQFSINCSIPSVINIKSNESSATGPAQATALEVAEECKKNQVAAENKYKGKVVEATGTIRSFSNRADQGVVSIFVVLPNKYTAIGHVRSNDTETINSLSVGQTVTMTGTVEKTQDNGKLGGMIFMGKVKISSSK